MSSASSDPLDQAFPDASPSGAPAIGDPIDEAFKDHPTNDASHAPLSPLKELYGSFIEPGAAMLTGAIAKPVSDIAGLAATAYDAVTGNPNTDAPGFQRYVQDALTYQPRTASGIAAVDALSKFSDATIGAAAKAAAKNAQGSAQSLGLPRAVSEGVGNAVQEAVMQAPNLLGAKAISSKAARGASSAEAASAGAATPGFDTTPVEGGVPQAAQIERAQVLQRVGLDKARMSAITGDAKSGATDFQLAKFDEPAGVEAKAQFDNERDALRNHAESIVNDTGGSLGTDEDTLNARGRTIAAPFDQLRNWFDAQKQKLYTAANERAQGAPIGDVGQVDALLKDPDFSETLLAKDQGGLLGSVQRQWDRFKALNPDGMTVENAENFRKWLNKIWTPENSHTLGQVKGTLDDAVLKGAGEDIYGPARALAQTEFQTLDNPNGVSRLMDVDPKNPLNRATPYAKIPDTLSRLDPDQFANVLKTLDTMPEEIQGAAQAAKSEIKAHLANKLLDAGSSTAGQWNAPAVSKVIKANSAKLQSAFEDQPDVLSKIQDLDSAGKILKVNQSYPGAAAQAANAVKRGMMSKIISKGASATGALVGSGVGGALGMPGLGASAGAAAGETAGNALGQGVAERAAVKRWKQGTVSLSDLLKQANKP